MGYKITEIELPTGYSNEMVEARISKLLHINRFRYEILGLSLDARNKKSIHWQARLGIFSDELKGGIPEKQPELEIPVIRKKKKAVVLGSGPAGFFAAWVLQKAGFETTIAERGAEVDKRGRGIKRFEQTGIFDPLSNYAYGEGGAGTFSDGKLTSRSKHISAEKRFILDHYVRAGAPEEIAYLAYPHIGSDNLKTVVKNLRDQFTGMGGKILFESLVKDLRIVNGHVTAAVTSAGVIEGDIFILAPGHSSYETFRMLISRGIPFRTKNFALGFRAEHPQELINRAQWGHATLPGVKAAEYRLTSNREGRLPVFTFCMCPGGIVVPATASSTGNIVNGMSYYKRNGRFANAACVAGIHPDQLCGHETSPAEALDTVEQLENLFFETGKGYKAPFCTIADFHRPKLTGGEVPSSYPLGLVQAPLWEMLPGIVISAIKEGLTEFSHKLKGYETGILLGLESKTSSPIQVVRDESGKCGGFDNLYLAGEGSGFSGGIISSGADGIRIAMEIAQKK